jgi:hypothetical protein
MTTLAADSLKDRVLGDLNHIPVIASDIIYEGAAVGVVKASGHARPLQATDKFAGFAERKADNSAGNAADINVQTLVRGTKVLSVTGAVITDIGQPVYATDDNAFVFNPVGAVFIGFLRRFISSGVVEVAFDVVNFVDPYSAHGGVYETVADNLTLDIQDNGKVLFVTTDAKTITLPVVATVVNCTIVNIGAYGTVAVNISPQSADMIHAPNIAGTDDKDLINTKATAQRGDLCTIRTGDATGWVVSNLKGVWAKQG